MRSQNRSPRISFLTTISSLLLICASAVLAADDGQIDWQKARELLRRQRQGQSLTDEEKAYLGRARQQRAAGRPGRARPQGEGRPQRDQALTGKETTGMIPLPELVDGEYKGQRGGLYGNGKNTPPASHQAAVKKELAEIRPLDADGKPSRDGKIVLLSLGMSNTTQEFSQFKKMADADPNKSPSVVIVDCAQGGQAAAQWAYPEKYRRTNRRTGRQRPSPWVVMDERIKNAGVAAGQVQLVWIKQAEMGPANLGEFPKHARVLQKNIAVILRKLKDRFPNLRIAYLSSRIYAGYAGGPLNPEPYAYESAFSVRWLIEDQIGGKPEFNYDPKKGKVKSPLLLWGPYLWGDGMTPRKSDGLVWKREDLAGDGTHPSQSGRRKVAEMLLRFFKTDVNAGGRFLKRSD
ncbi:MAG: hypothetical protein ISS79_04330 [Phycisphaerae bacterium]|nr:hypothetical protein [Phycisphaerae bacterium]